MHIAMTAAHGGYNSDKLPLGGGAAVCERLCQVWGSRQDLKVTLIGSGPDAPPGVDYLRAGGLLDKIPSQLNELEYARFSRRFEKEASQHILALQPRPVVLSHDISEGPNFAQLARQGVDCLSILHVDVVDYFQRFYLGDRLPTFWWTWFHRQTRQLPWPDLLKLVFEKQLQASRHCRHLIVPSTRMVRILHDSYPHLPPGRVQVVPWGSPLAHCDPHEVEAAKSRLRQAWQLHPQAPLILTLSRIAPEKGQDELLRALKVGEELGKIPPGLTLAIVGAPSYMMGQRYLQKLKKLASQLRRVRVLFPGHLGGADKRAALEMASQFVVCSRHESYGLTIMEAMAAGLPIVARRSYGVEATVEPSWGTVVEEGRDFSARMWSQIESNLNHPEQARAMGQAGATRASQENFLQAADRVLQLCRGSHLEVLGKLAGKLA